MVKLENWKVVGSRDPYLPPELNHPRLAGVAYGHPKLGDTVVVTSPIVDWFWRRGSRVVVTRTGTEYVLGRIEEGYRKWLREHRPNWNWREPITIIEGV